MSWSGNAKRRITGGGLDISVDRPYAWRLPTTTAFGLGRHQVARSAEAREVLDAGSPCCAGSGCEH
jgi:hypothetical protein